MSQESAYDERAQKFWSLYVQEAEQHDTNTTESWKGDMDSTLIFAGLFSATVTAFIIESYKLLQADSGAATTALLTQILAAQVVGFSLNATAIPFPTNVAPPSPFKPGTSVVAVNVLWFLSLACSLATALGVTLVQQWTRDYLQRIERINQPQRRATIRGIMFSGIRKWRMRYIVDCIPTLLHLSLFLFFAGLCLFLWTIDVTTASAVVAIVVCFLSFYILATIAPLVDLSTPYETPFSSLLWKILPHEDNTQSRISTKSRSLTHAREALAFPPLDKISLNTEGLDIVRSVSSESESFQLVSLHRNIQAVTWVYDRISDDGELQEFIGSIPGLLGSRDGPIIWNIFLSKSPDMVEEIENRIGRLLQSCAFPGYLELAFRRTRATVCVDALLAMTSVRKHFNSPRFNPELNATRLINTAWDDDNVLVSKSLSLRAILDCRLYASRPSSFSSHEPPKENVDLRTLSVRADHALKDIDDMRQIVEDVFQESQSPNSQTWCKADIASLLGVYFAVMNEKTLALADWINTPDRAQHVGLANYTTSFENDFKLWRDRIPSGGIQISYEGILSFESQENVKLDLHAYQIFAFLRLHGLYPLLPDMMEPALQGLSNMWFPLLGRFPTQSDSGSRTFKPFSQDGGSPHTADTTDTQLEPIDPEGPAYKHFCRELLPISSLLDLLEAGPTATITVYVQGVSPSRPQRPWLLGFAPCPSRLEGPFSSFTSILEAALEENSLLVGFMQLILMIKIYSPKVCNPSIIAHALNYVCPVLFPVSMHGLKLSKGSQILFVVVLREILALERDASSSVPCPFSSESIDDLLYLLRYLDHELPLAMAEQALGTTLDHDLEVHSSSVSALDDFQVDHRVRYIQDYIQTHRIRILES